MQILGAQARGTEGAAVHVAAGEIFDGWGGSRGRRDPEHTPVVCEESRRAGDRARREKIPAAPW